MSKSGDYLETKDIIKILSRSEPTEMRCPDCWHILGKVGDTEENNEYLCLNEMCLNEQIYTKEQF